MGHYGRMAYPTGANLNALLLQQLNFRTSGNYPISSLYTLYANGHGQTFWSNSVNPSIISTLSGEINNNFINLSSQISTLFNNSTFYKELSTLEHYTYSTFSTVFYEIELLGNQSTSLNDAFLSTANSFQIQLNSYYQSTLDVAYSTLNSLATLSSFNYQLSTQGIYFANALSTMSTGIGIQDATTSTLIINYVEDAIASTFAWTAGQISSIAYFSATSANVNTVSTTINYALLSTSTGLSGEIDATNAFAQYLNTALGRNSTAILSSSGGILTITSNLSVELYGVSTSLSTLNNEFGLVTSTVNGFTTLYTTQIPQLSTGIGINSLEISSLSAQVSTITTSSILEGIYASFIELEAYTVALINSTNNAALSSFNAIQLSTTIYLESTNIAYFTFFSTTYSTQVSQVEQNLTSTLSIFVSTFASTTTTFIHSLSTSVSTISGNVSTSLSTVTGDFNVALYTLSGEISTALYTLSGEISTIGANANTIVSSINAVQQIVLTSNNYIGMLDFVTYRNFNVQVYNILNVNNSSYSINFNPNTLSNVTLQQGVILIDVSTNTQAYTQNNNQLFLNFNRWGIINGARYNPFPMLANSAYKMEFIYSLYNSNLYTSLTNIWPYQNTSNLNVSSINDNTALDPSNIGIFSTGTQLELTWQTYLFSTFISSFSSFVAVDVDISGALIQTYGPFSYTVSSVMISMPDGGYPAGTGFASTNFISYIVGEPAQGSVFQAAAYYP